MRNIKLLVKQKIIVMTSSVGFSVTPAALACKQQSLIHRPEWTAFSPNVYIRSFRWSPVWSNLFYGWYRTAIWYQYKIRAALAEIMKHRAIILVRSEPFHRLKLFIISKMKTFYFFKWLVIMSCLSNHNIKNTCESRKRWTCQWYSLMTNGC